jgi:hypothetical protein
MPWSSEIPARYLPCTWPGSQRRRPAPQRADAGTLARPRYTPGTSTVRRRAETSAGVRYLEPGHHPPAVPPPAPPRREASDELKPATAFRITARSTQLRRPRPGAVGDLDPDDAVPGDDRDRDRLPGSTRAAVPDRITEDLADQQDGHIPARVPRGPSTSETNVRAARARSARPASVTLSRTASPAITAPALPRPPRPRETGRAAGGRREMHAQLGRERQARTRPPQTLSVARPSPRRPSVAVRAKPTVPRTAPTPRTPSAMCPWTPQHGGLQRDKVTRHGTEKKRPASARIRSKRAVFAGSGRCWVRTNVG